MKTGDLIKVDSKQSIFNGMRGEIIDRKGVLKVPAGAIPVSLDNGVVFCFYPDEIYRVPKPYGHISKVNYSKVKEKYKHPWTKKKQAFKFNLLARGDREVGIPSVDEEVVVIFKNGGWNYQDTEKWLHEVFSEFVDNGYCTKV